jgi:hypothetical protein
MVAQNQMILRHIVSSSEWEKTPFHGSAFARLFV